jgi:ligand-binding sensor domain-containing protein
MKKHLQIYAVCLLFIFSLFACKGQIKTDLSTDSVPQVESNLLENTEPKTILGSYGPNSITRTIKQDKKGNIWLASWEGIIRYDGTTFTNITNKVSLSRFFSVLEDRKGNFWFASVGEGVFYYDGKSFTNFTTKDGLVNDRVTHIYEAKDGKIWFGTEGGASCYDGKTFRNFTTKEGLPNNDVNAIIEDETGKFWFGTRGEACFYDGEVFTKCTNNLGEPFMNIRSIIKDKKGNIWLGGNDGLWRYEGNSFINFTTEFVGYIYEDRKGNIWTTSKSAYTSGWSLSRYDAKSVAANKAIPTPIKTGNGMYFGILEDKAGNIWFGSLNGVCRYDGYVFDYFKAVNIKD